MKPNRLITTLLAFALLLVPAFSKPPPKRVTFAGGDGSTMEKAIIVKAADEESGVHAEYEYIDKHFPGNQRGGQSLQQANGKHYDVLEFTTAKGEKKTLYFDITAFFGKLK